MSRCTRPFLTWLDLEERQAVSNTPVQVCNLEIKVKWGLLSFVLSLHQQDNHESASVGARNLVKLASMVHSGTGSDVSNTCTA